MKYFFSAIINFADFQGRARRKEFWYFNLVNFIFFSIALHLSLKHKRPEIIIAYSMIIAVPTISLGYRRMHDIGEFGWNFFIPVYNLILACIEGANRVNKFGDDPKKIKKSED